MPVMKKRHAQMQRTGFGNSVIGAARFGNKADKNPLNFGKTAVRFGRGALEVGKKGYELGRNRIWQQEAIREQRGKTLTDVELKPPSVEEELEAMRERNVEKLLKRFPPHVVEELAELIEEAMKQQIGGHEMHRLLGTYFSKRFPDSDKANLARWIRAILRTTHPDYAKDLKVE